MNAQEDSKARKSLRGGACAILLVSLLLLIISAAAQHNPYLFPLFGCTGLLGLIIGAIVGLNGLA